jgi:hypothetical protein
MIGDIWQIHEDVDLATRDVPNEIQNAWRHAEAAYRISCKYGQEVAWWVGLLQELLRPGPADREVDFMNNWQGMSYGMSANELARRGLLIESEWRRHAPVDVR